MVPLKLFFWQKTTEKGDYYENKFSFYRWIYSYIRIVTTCRFIIKKKSKQRRIQMIIALTAIATTAVVDAFLSGCVAGISFYTGKTTFKKGRIK